MASITTNSVLNTNALGIAFSQIKDRVVKQYMFRKTISELRSLSRLELADLGLTQSGIKAAAYEAVYGV